MQPALAESPDLPDVEFRPSPNRDSRPADMEIDLLVIHNISLPPGHFGGPWVDSFFLNQLDAKAHPYFEQLAQLRVSAHLFIRRDGSAVQYVPLTERAWHAGQSSFQGRQACNDFSIGIELEGADDLAYSQAQYERLAQLTRMIQARYPGISRDHILGHSDIAPGRKSDPGPAFDWPLFHQLLDMP
jgi:AmpD protein